MKTKEEIVKIIKEDRLIKKYLYPCLRPNGSDDIIPITIWAHDITIRLTARKNVFRKCIERIIKASEGLFDFGCFSYDGSCPAFLTFFFADK